MAAASAGILLYRHSGNDILVLLVHPGGPFWARRDLGAWSIPKGEFDANEEPADAARREFAEELGVDLTGEVQPLGEIRQKGGKRVVGFVVEGDLDVAAIRSNTFEIEWPPRSGRMQSFPEIDRAEWFDLDAARKKMIPGQLPFLDRLEMLIRGAEPQA
jgi:predicted NUDIX family NTP pyrophosphohydrolase